MICDIFYLIWWEVDWTVFVLNISLNPKNIIPIKYNTLWHFHDRRPSGDPELDVLAHTAPYKLKEKERLQGILSDLQSQNKLLKDAVRARQSKLEHTQQKIEEKARQWREVSHERERERESAQMHFTFLTSVFAIKEVIDGHFSVFCFTDGSYCRQFWHGRDKKISYEVFQSCKHSMTLPDVWHLLKHEA